MSLPTPAPGPSYDVLLRRLQKLQALLEVAKNMAVRRELFELMQLVIQEAVTVADADRGSVWLLDRDHEQLYTYVAQGVEPLRIPMSAGIVGAVAMSGRSLKVPDAYADPRFDRHQDEVTGYRTRNILGVPMWSVDQSVFGVLQVLNKREDVDGGRFTDDDQELLTAFGGQAAAALQSALFYEEIQQLFEGFIKASVVAIEARDPTTSGHSERVAVLTCGLAEAVERGGGHGRWRGIHFTVDEMREIRYAALLHDFGKIGVREEVLVKADKLYPHQRENLELRFDFVRRTIESDFHKKRFELAAPSGAAIVSAALAEEEKRYRQALAEVDEIQQFCLTCNKPTVLEQGGFERLQEIQKRVFRGPNDQPLPFLSPAESSALSIRRGSLSPEERLQIESHVTHTYNFLSRIPWSPSLRHIPDIAYGHHEKLDAKGYPRHLGPDQISVQTRMMTISDIYDALTASDRPYKKAVPHAKAVDILTDESNKGMIDPDLLTIFIEAKVPENKLGKTAD